MINMEDIKSFIKIVILPIVAVILVAIAPIMLLSAWECSSYEKITGRLTKYSGLVCYAQIDGVWYSSDEYNKIFVAERKSLEVKIKD